MKTGFSTGAAGAGRIRDGLSSSGPVAQPPASKSTAPVHARARVWHMVPTFARRRAAGPPRKAEDLPSRQKGRLMPEGRRRVKAKAAASTQDVEDEGGDVVLAAG